MGEINNWNMFKLRLYMIGIVLFELVFIVCVCVIYFFFIVSIVIIVRVGYIVVYDCKKKNWLSNKYIYFLVFYFFYNIDVIFVFCFFFYFILIDLLIEIRKMLVMMKFVKENRNLLFLFYIICVISKIN